MNDRPNMLLFLADDLSKRDVGCYGNAVVRTPHINRLAAEGMRFERAYTPEAMCAPSRAALLTGLGPHRNGCHMNHGQVKPGVQTLPAALRALGYRVAVAGKTHFGPKASFPFEYIPFDKQAAGHTSTHHELDWQAIEAFIARDETPFCLFVASSEPHRPHGRGGFAPQDVPVPPTWVDTPETRQTLADYYHDIAVLDAELGRCRTLLETHGRLAQTLLAFGADHGYEMFAKWSCYEAGTNIPFIVRWPERVAASSVSHALLSYVDVLPTLIAAAGGEPAEELDGRSFLPVLRGEVAEHRQQVFSTHTNRGILSGQTYPIRAVHERRYKYIRNLHPAGRFQNVNTHGMHWCEADAEPEWASWLRAAEAGDTWAQRRVAALRDRPAEELYDLATDPHELQNLAPQPAHTATCNRLSAALGAWMRQQGDPGMPAEMAVPLYGGGPSA